MIASRIALKGNFSIIYVEYYILFLKVLRFCIFYIKIEVLLMYSPDIVL